MQRSGWSEADGEAVDAVEPVVEHEANGARRLEGGSVKLNGTVHSALMMDLGDVAGNVSDGVHIASTGGVWMTLVFGFAGVRDFDGVLRVDPRLPRSWKRLRVPIRFQDRQITVELTHDEERYSITEGEPLEIYVRGAPHVLTVDAPLVLESTSAQP